MHTSPLAAASGVRAPTSPSMGEVGFSQPSSEKPGEGGRMPRDWTGMMLPPSPGSLPAVVTKPDVPCRASIYRRACEARCPADRWVTKLTGYMGDSFSCFGVRRLPVPGDGQATQFLLVGIDPADRHVEEADLPLTRLGLRQGDGF